MLGYMRRRRLQFGALFLLIAGATCCAVAAQYGMKLIVDEMTLGDRAATPVWLWVGLSSA